MRLQEANEIVLVSSGHPALDHRVFDKEAMTLAAHFPHVRVVAAHPADEVRGLVQITALTPTRSRLKRFLWRPLQCFLAARGPGARLLILQDAELLIWVPLVKLLTGWRIVYDVHEDFPQLLLRRTWIPLPVRRALSPAIGALEKVLARCCDGITGATSVLVDYFAPRPRVALYNLPSVEFVNAASETARPLDEREFDVVHLGTLSDERLEFLMEVLDALFARRPAARALVLGVQAEQMRRLQGRYASAHVTAIEKVDYEQIAGYLGNCRIGIDVHPILYPHLRCAVPVKVFEYMASGCNVITSYLPELHRVLGDEGAEHISTIFTMSAEAFADDSIRLLDDHAALHRHQTALLGMVRTRWNWEHEAEKMVQFITRIRQGKEIISREQVLDH
ncbi:MAG TPA: glycosyltransferase [Armatimonadota bacterium]|jgi:glycosyltransferase involved in cell wall biosynthesis